MQEPNCTDLKGCSTELKLDSGRYKELREGEVKRSLWVKITLSK